MSQRQDYLELEHEQEYTTRVLVFKVNDRSEMDCHHTVRYNLRMFKGTRAEFDSYYTEHVGHKPKVDYMVYDKQEQIDNVTHGAKDNNIRLYPKSEWQKECEQRNEDNRYLKGGY
jgi:hypothetical protein